MRTRLTDEEVARFTAQRYRFPGVDIQARLFRQYPLGEVASHVIGYIGRINQTRGGEASRTATTPPTTTAPTTSARKASRRATRRSCTARPATRKSKFGRRPRGAHAVAHAGHAGQQPDPVARHRAAEGRRGGVRRPARRAGRDRAGDRRRAGLCVACRPSTPTCSSTASTSRAGTSSTPRPTSRWSTARCRAAIRPARPSSPSWRWPRWSWASARRRPAISDPGYFILRRPPLPRRQGGRPRHGRHVPLDRAVLRHLLLPARQRPRHRRDARLHEAVRFRPDHRHRPRAREARRAAVDRPGSASASYRQPEQQKWYAGETISLGIGQGYNSYTPLQLAHATATLANNGVVMKPHLVKFMEDGGTRARTPTVPKESYRIPLKQENIDVIKNAMVGVTREGTAARAFANAGYTSGGKTGTAQVIAIKKNEKYNASTIAERLRDHALFTAFAPADKPRIAHRRDRRERRLRRGRRRADRAQGARLLPARQARRPEPPGRRADREDRHSETRRWPRCEPTKLRRRPARRRRKPRATRTRPMQHHPNDARSGSRSSPILTVVRRAAGADHVPAAVDRHRHAVLGRHRFPGPRRRPAAQHPGRPSSSCGSPPTCRRRP